MSDDPVRSMSAIGLLSGYRRAELSPVDVLEALIARAEAWEPELNALVTASYAEARAAARVSARRWERGGARPLEGIPVLVKDLIDTDGLRTTLGSAMFADRVPAADAEVVAMVRRAGGIVLAKTATHEFAWGITTDSAAFGPTRNPWAPGRTPGGSSGGSAAALAAGYAPLALGSDTAGSIRIPAAFCGVAGLKPTFGAVPTEGVAALAPSLDHVGPMARTVEDLRLLWSVLGPSAPGRRLSAAPRVGLLLDLAGPAPDAATVLACRRAADALTAAGAHVVELAGDELPPPYPILAATVLAEGLRTHRRLGWWPARAGEYGADVRARLELATRTGPADYLDAQARRAALRAGLARWLADVDVLLSPVSGEGPCEVGRSDPGYRERVMTYTAPQSLAGVPALTLRAGFDPGGLPVGVQLTGRPWREDQLLELAARLSAQLADPEPTRWPDPSPTDTDTDSDAADTDAADTDRTDTDTDRGVSHAVHRG
ncbi:MAG TPA: amidase [Pseudonocardia sp.]|nr:amidase [Pseudonocardia sp.]